MWPAVGILGRPDSPGGGDDSCPHTATRSTAPSSQPHAEALDASNVDLVLPFVPEDDEDEVRAMFDAGATGSWHG